MDVNPQEGRDERYNELTRILKDLPKHHKETIEKIFYHLGSVARRSEENRMDPQSLAIVLAPCIIRYVHRGMRHPGKNQIFEETTSNTF